MKDRIDELLEQAYSKPIAPPAGLTEKIERELSVSPVRGEIHRRRRWEIAAAMLLLCGVIWGVWMAADGPRDNQRDLSSDSAMVRATEKPRNEKTQNGIMGEKGWDNLTGREGEEQPRGDDFAQPGQSTPFRNSHEGEDQGSKSEFGTGERNLDAEQTQDLPRMSASPQELPKVSPEPGDKFPEVSPESKDEKPEESPDSGKEKEYIQLCSVEGVYFSAAGENQNGIAIPEESPSTDNPLLPAGTQAPVSTEGIVSIEQAENDIELFSQRILYSESELSALLERARDPQIQSQKRLDTTQLLSELAGYGDEYFQSYILCIHTISVQKGQGLGIRDVVLRDTGTNRETLAIQLQKTWRDSETINNGYLICAITVPKSILHENTSVRFEGPD